MCKDLGLDSKSGYKDSGGKLHESAKKYNGDISES